MASKKNSVAGIPGKDKTLPNVKLTVFGKVYQLAFDFHSIAIAEELTGLNLLNSLDLQNLNATKYRALLYSALLKAQPEITLEETADLVTLATLPDITVALVHAWTGSQPEVIVDKDAKDENPPVGQIELPL
jgi:hypothetical protein